MMGPITGQPLLLFFLILLGTSFQQPYNTVNTVIVGNFIGTDTALAAVGSATDQLVNLFVDFFISLFSGCGVVISQYYDACDRNVASKSVHVVLALSLVSGVVITVPGLTLARFLLRTMSPPDGIMLGASAYLRIYSLDMISNLSYNMGAAVLRAVGDSGRPFYFLILSCLSNIVLDLVFMVSLHAGIAGAALATTFSQTVSMIMALYALFHMDSKAYLNPRELRMNLGRLKKMIYVSLPADLQGTTHIISSITVQTTANSSGTNTIAAVTAYGKMDVLFWTVINALDIAIMTFVGQNYGAGQVKRASQGFRVSSVLSIFVTPFLSAVIWFLSMDFLHFFTKDPAVLAICRRLIHYVAPSFITYIPIELCSGTLRGMGNSWIPMTMIVISVCVLRLFWIFLVVSLHCDILALMTAYLISWITASIAPSLYLFLTRHRYRLENLVKQNEKSIAI